MQQGIKKLQWFEYFKVVFLEILNAGLCRVFANQVTYVACQPATYNCHIYLMQVHAQLTTSTYVHYGSLI